MLEAQKQQHLRSLRRSLNRAVTSVKDDGRVVCHSGWTYGESFFHTWLEGRGYAGAPRLDPALFEETGEPTLMLPPFDEEVMMDWGFLFPETLRKALTFFWPGPLLVRVTVPHDRLADDKRLRLTVACPWHHLMKELLSRSGPLFWYPCTPEQQEVLHRNEDPPEFESKKTRVLHWPEKDSPITPTFLDATTRPWRILEQGFVPADELMERVEEPVLLSEERAFPRRSIRTYVPEGRTIIVEAKDKSLLPKAVQTLRGQVPPDAFVRIYLDESTAHNHFPDDREVRVYGELSDPERVRRRLQAMLERQGRKFGKRVLLIAVTELDKKSESFRADLEKMSDGWLTVESEEVPSLDEA